jgi:hypothetical protein
MFSFAALFSHMEPCPVEIEHILHKISVFQQRKKPSGAAKIHFDEFFNFFSGYLIFDKYYSIIQL